MGTTRGEVGDGASGAGMWHGCGDCAGGRCLRVVGAGTCGECDDESEGSVAAGAGDDGDVGAGGAEERISESDDIAGEEAGVDSGDASNGVGGGTEGTTEGGAQGEAPAGLREAIPPGYGMAPCPATDQLRRECLWWRWYRRLYDHGLLAGAWLVSGSGGSCVCGAVRVGLFVHPAATCHF